MGIKIKKEPKPQNVKLKELKVKYTLAVPLIGVIDILTMMSCYLNPVNAENTFAKAFFIFFAIVGAGYAYWGLKWKIVSDNKKIMVCPAFGRVKEIQYSDIKKVEVHKKPKNKVLLHFSLHGANDEIFVKVYPIMNNSGELLERLKRLGITIQEMEGR